MTDSPVILPTELNYLVLEYAGKVRQRNGKYMNQIPKDDPRYDILKRLPKKLISHNMIHNQMCWIVDVFTDKNACGICSKAEDNHAYYERLRRSPEKYEILAQYMENYWCFPNGEINITYFINGKKSDRYVLGNKYPPCFVHADDYKTTKKWIEYVPDL